MRDFVVKIAMSDRIKNPAVALTKLVEGTFHYELGNDAHKLVDWAEITDDTGKVIGKNTVIDWGD